MNGEIKNAKTSYRVIVETCNNELLLYCLLIKDNFVTKVITTYNHKLKLNVGLTKIESLTTFPNPFYNQIQIITP